MAWKHVSIQSPNTWGSRYWRIMAIAIAVVVLIIYVVFLTNKPKGGAGSAH
jgi:hypothetical protein